MATEGALWLIRTASVCASTPPLCASRGRRVRAWGLHHGSRLCVKMDFAYLQHTPAPGVAQLESGLDWAALRRPRPHETNLTRATPLTGSPHAPQTCVKMDSGSTPHTPAPGDTHLEPELDWTAHTRPSTIVTCPGHAVPLTRRHLAVRPMCAPQAQAQQVAAGIRCAGRYAVGHGRWAQRARADRLGSRTTTVGSEANVAAAVSAWPRGA